jgi:CRP-like cAMP-binding protein
VEELAELADAALESLACVMVDRSFGPGEVLMYQGQDMEDMLIISQGTVKV